jgi:hypothetical protein
MERQKGARIVPRTTQKRYALHPETEAWLIERGKSTGTSVEGMLELAVFAYQQMCRKVEADQMYSLSRTTGKQLGLDES